MDKVIAGWMAPGLRAVIVMTGLIFPVLSMAEGDSFQQLDAEVEEVLNEVVSLGAEMAILEESRELSPSNQLLVLVSLDHSRFFKLEAVQLKINERTASYHQYSEADLAAMMQGGSHRLFWDDVPSGRHQISLALFGHVPGDPDFQREATQMVTIGNGRRVVELRVSSGMSQAYPEVNIREWK